MEDEHIINRFRQATEAASKHQYWLALEHYTELLGLIPPQTTNNAVREKRLTALRERGRLLGLLGEQEAALSAYIQYHRETEDDTRRLDALIKLGDQLREIGRFDQALDAYDEAMPLAETTRQENGYGRVLVGIGLTKLVLGRTDVAIEHLNQATRIFEQTGNAFRQIQTLNRIGVAHAYSGHLQRAIVTFEEALHLSRKIGQQNTAVAALNNLGEVYQYLFDYQQALVYHEEALILAEENRLRIIQADICRNMGLELCGLDQLDIGLEYLHRALSISAETKHQINYSHTLYALALTEINRQNQAQAFHYANQLKNIASQSDSHNLLAAAYYALGLYHNQAGDAETAEQMWQQTLFLAHEANNQMLLWQTHAALAQIAALPDLAPVHQNIAAEVIRQIAEPIANPQLRHKFLSAPAVQKILPSA